MSGPLRVGILSFAHYHANFWAEAIVASPDAALVGVWDADRARGAEVADRFATRFHADLDALLESCDAVGITSETLHHASLVEAAAARGVHVLCEKPMATTLADCDRIVRAVRTAGVVYMQSFPKRFDPINRELVELVQRGDLGRLSLVRVRHAHFHGLDPAFAQRWLADPELAGGGTLLDEGIHAADFLRWLLGDPVDVRATISDRALGLPVEDTAVAVFGFPSGVIAEVATSWSMIAADTSIEVYGTDGSALLAGVDLASRDFASSPYLRVFRGDGERGRWEPSPSTPSFVAGGFHQEVARRFVACVRNGREPPVGLSEGRASLAMILAAYRAAGSGQAQAI
jgi:predicted dehydrogenase